MRWFAAALIFAFPLFPAHAEDIPWVWHSSDAPKNSRHIAVLLDHFNFSGEEILVRHRRRELLIDKDTFVTPVIHVQSDLKRPPLLDARHTRVITEAIQSAAQRSNSGWVQLDFEALDSQQAYYLGLIKSLRHELPPHIKLSVTVLASWCAQKGLLDKIDAEEIVPMFFHMGAGTEAYRDRLIYEPQFLNERCRQQAAGFGVQEAPPKTIQQRYTRRYWFNNRGWDNPSRGE